MIYNIIRRRSVPQIACGGCSLQQMGPTTLPQPNWTLMNKYWL